MLLMGLHRGQSCPNFNRPSILLKGHVLKIWPALLAFLHILAVDFSVQCQRLETSILVSVKGSILSSVATKVASVEDDDLNLEFKMTRGCHLVALFSFRSLQQSARKS
ncbi:hypothetical protein CMV_013875 [Castanea mollissima]|uniref:Uncharacterized protein n=1 Tax=Castanea mollissima TaxID=60419 RepID=A0A8J4QYQ0_9ROSI|nr:hypothetical protein CMV_013875 [Castanea mollissima]